MDSVMNVVGAAMVIGFLLGCVGAMAMAEITGSLIEK